MFNKLFSLSEPEPKALGCTKLFSATDAHHSLDFSCRYTFPYAGILIPTRCQLKNKPCLLTGAALSRSPQ